MPAGYRPRSSGVFEYGPIAHRMYLTNRQYSSSLRFIVLLHIWVIQCAGRINLIQNLESSYRGTLASTTSCVIVHSERVGVVAP